MPGEMAPLDPQRMGTKQLMFLLYESHIELKNELKSDRETATRRLDNHAQRISSLEVWRNWIVGAGAAISTIGGIIWRLAEKGHISVRH